jgi:hypothetical protein
MKATNTKDVPDRWRRILQRVARGEDWPSAAKLEGYSHSYARVISTRMMRNSAAAAVLEEIRQKGREMAAFGLVEAMREADDAATFAREKGNSMALVKAVELRSKLSGLLIDRVELVPVDLVAALERAERRVSNPIDITPTSAPSPIRWTPRIPGQGEGESGASA